MEGKNIGVLKDIKSGEYRVVMIPFETSGIQDRPWVPPERILGIEDSVLDPAPPATVTESCNYYPEFM